MMTKDNLLEKLDAIIASLENGVQSKVFDFKFQTKDVSNGLQIKEANVKYNVLQIALGAVTTAIIGFLISNFFGVNSKMGAFLGAFSGGIASVAVQKKKLETNQTSNIEIPKADNDLQKEKIKIISEIKNTNQWIRDYWEEKVRALVVEVKDSIKNSTLNEYEQNDLMNKILVNKSIIIFDSHYTNAIDDLAMDTELESKLKLQIDTWKEAVCQIIKQTARDQFDTYFCKLYEL